MWEELSCKVRHQLNRVRSTDHSFMLLTDQWSQLRRQHCWAKGAMGLGSQELEKNLGEESCQAQQRGGCGAKEPVAQQRLPLRVHTLTPWKSLGGSFSKGLACRSGIWTRASGHGVHECRISRSQRKRWEDVLGSQTVQRMGRAKEESSGREKSWAPLSDCRGNVWCGDQLSVKKLPRDFKFVLRHKLDPQRGCLGQDLTKGHPSQPQGRVPGSLCHWQLRAGGLFWKGVGEGTWRTPSPC